MEIQGTTVLVTGANRGLGRHLVDVLLERGAAKVYAASRVPVSSGDPRVAGIALDLTNQELRELHYCGETVEYDCEAGDIECRATASTNGMQFYNLRWHDEYRILVDVTGFANNPCMRGSPDIGYIGVFCIDLAEHTVSFDGRVHGFPAYEAYASVNGGPTMTLFNYGPRGGPSDLAEMASDPVVGTAQF